MTGDANGAAVSTPPAKDPYFYFLWYTKNFYLHMSRKMKDFFRELQNVFDFKEDLKIVYGNNSHNLNTIMGIGDVAQYKRFVQEIEVDIFMSPYVAEIWFQEDGPGIYGKHIATFNPIVYNRTARP